MERPLALVIDRDPATREQIRTILAVHDVDVRGASNAAETTEAFRIQPIRLVIFDVDTPGLNTKDLVVRASRLEPSPIVIAVTATDDGGRAHALVDSGAFDVIGKPVDEARLQLIVRSAVRHQAIRDELGALRDDLQRREGYDGLVGRSPQMERLRVQITRLAEGEAPVWFCGEDGSGKEHAARELHRCSRRAASRFETVVCAGLDRVALASRLGLAADGSVVAGGLLAALRHGTLYLVEPAALSPDEQGLLLRVLDTAGSKPVDVRVLASSTVAPRILAEDGRLLEPLHTRLAGETVMLPALRERIEDVPLLARHFIRTICAINQLPPIRLEADAVALLERRLWPENVQGLRNALEQAVILSPDGKIRPRDLGDGHDERSRGGVSTSGSGVLREFREAKREVVEEFERSYLRSLMDRHGGNVTAASQQAGMLRSALQRLLRKYGLKSADFRRSRQTTTTRDVTRPRS